MLDTYEILKESMSTNRYAKTDLPLLIEHVQNGGLVADLNEHMLPIYSYTEFPTNLTPSKLSQERSLRLFQFWGKDFAARINLDTPALTNNDSSKFLESFRNRTSYYADFPASDYRRIYLETVIQNIDDYSTEMLRLQENGENLLNMASTKVAESLIQENRTENPLIVNFFTEPISNVHLINEFMDQYRPRDSNLRRDLVSSVTLYGWEFGGSKSKATLRLKHVHENWTQNSGGVKDEHLAELEEHVFSNIISPYFDSLNPMKNGGMKPILEKAVDDLSDHYGKNHVLTQWAIYALRTQRY